MIRTSYFLWTTKQSREQFLITQIRIIAIMFWKSLLKMQDISASLHTFHSRDNIQSFLSTNCVFISKTIKSIKMKSLSNSNTLNELSLKLKLQKRLLMTKTMRHKQRQMMKSKLEQYWKASLLRLFNHSLFKSVSFVFKNDINTNDFNLNMMRMSEIVIMQTIKSN